MNFFADELPTSAIVPGNAVTIVIVIWTLITFLGIIAVLVGLGLAAKRKPAIEAEFATKAELNQLRSEMKHDMGILFGKIDTLTASVNHSTNSIQRDLGKHDYQGQLVTALVEAVRK